MFREQQQNFLKSKNKVTKTLIIYMKKKYNIKVEHLQQTLRRCNQKTKKGRIGVKD